MLDRFTGLFPVWAVLVSLLGYFAPGRLTGFQDWIVPLLAGVMFMMGLTLTPADFRRIARTPRPVLIGVVLQFLIMPLSAFILAGMLQLSIELTAGLVLVGSCAGGTASNVVCYLARGDVALSISMTMVSTLAGVLATPLLCKLYLSATVAVDSVGMLFDIVQVVLLPVAGGIILNRLTPGTVNRCELWLPSLSMIAILLIVAIIVALNAERLLQVGLVALIAVVLHNTVGLTAGYSMSRLLGLDTHQSRTVSIEVGMQNSGLGVALALEFFSAAAALPGALFSIWHNISGSLLASWWSRRPDNSGTPCVN